MTLAADPHRLTTAQHTLTHTHTQIGGLVSLFLAFTSVRGD